MLPSIRLSHVTAGFTAVLVGYTSSVVIVIQAATTAGATSEFTASWLLILGLVMGVSSIGYSLYFRVPVLTAWSTPGAAMLVGVAGQYSIAECVGAFVISGILTLLTALVKPINTWLNRISAQLATAMLAAVLTPFCLNAFAPVSDSPATVALFCVSYFAGRRFFPKYTMLLLLVLAFGAASIVYGFQIPELSPEPTSLAWESPGLSFSAALNLALPLYIITMLSQNLPGVAMLKSYGYQIKTAPVLAGTGIATSALAPFGCFSANLAAISAAICMNDDVDSKQSERYKAAIWAGVFYLIAGIWASAVVALFLALPVEITQMLAGFALFGTLLMCLQTAFSGSDKSAAALLTFLITLSGVSIAGISAPILGLASGIILLKLEKGLSG